MPASGDRKIAAKNNTPTTIADAFRRLSDEQQQVILDAAAAAEAKGWEGVRKTAAEDTATLAENGITVSEPSEELMAELQKIGDIMVKEWEQEAPEEVGAILSNYR